MIHDTLPPPEYLHIDGSHIATYALEADNDHSWGELVLCHGTPSAASRAPVARMLAS